MAVLANAPMLMLCMLKITETPNFPQSLSHKHKHLANINLLHDNSKVQRPVIDVGKCRHMENQNALLQMLCHNCGKMGHYGKVCRNAAKSLNAVTTEDEESFFLGAVDTGKDPWTVQLQG